MKHGVEAVLQVATPLELGYARLVQCDGVPSASMFPSSQSANGLTPGFSALVRPAIGVLEGTNEGRVRRAGLVKGRPGQDARSSAMPAPIWRVDRGSTAPPGRGRVSLQFEPARANQSAQVG